MFFQKFKWITPIYTLLAWLGIVASLLLASWFYQYKYNEAIPKNIRFKTAICTTIIAFLYYFVFSNNFNEESNHMDKATYLIVYMPTFLALIGFFTYYGLKFTSKFLTIIMKKNPINAPVLKENHCYTCEICDKNPENTSGLHKLSIVPEEVKGWNWGACLLGGIWGIANKSYNACWVLLPYFGFYWSFVCGQKGNEWAWRNKKWESIEQFHSTQRKWGIYSALFWIAISGYITYCKLKYSGVH